MRLMIRSGLELSPEHVAAIKEVAPFDGDETHFRLRRVGDVDGTRCALKGVIGIHRAPRSGQDKAGATYLAYTLDLDIETDSQEPSVSDDWEKVIEVVSELAGKRQANVAMWAWFSPNQIAPATSLPIMLGESGLSGFTEIRGVRLAQPDPDDKENELYSVVLDKRSDGFGVTVETTVESMGLDADIVKRALDRLNGVATLAYKEVKKA